MLFSTSWGRFQRRFNNVIDDLSRHGEQIDKAANAYNIAEARQTRQHLESWRQAQLETVTAEEQEQLANHLSAVSTWIMADEDDQHAILEKIKEDGDKHTGTCSWVLKHRVFKPWLDSHADTAFLWLTGIPGSGKSILSGQLDTFSRSSGAFVASHFCTYTYASSTRYDKILRHILMQVLRGSDDMITHIYWEYVVAKKVPSTLNLENLLMAAVPILLSEAPGNRPLYIILDGFEEIEADKQRRLINLLFRLSTGTPNCSGRTCKVLLSSRWSSELESTLRKRAKVLLTNEREAIQDAIRIFATQRLQTHNMRHRFRQLGIQDHDVEVLADRIAERADGKAIAGSVS